MKNLHKTQNALFDDQTATDKATVVENSLKAQARESIYVKKKYCLSLYCALCFCFSLSDFFQLHFQTEFSHTNKFYTISIFI